MNFYKGDGIMKKYLSSVLIMLCILLSAVVASADKAEWKADNYDLSKVHKIYQMRA